MLTIYSTFRSFKHPRYKKIQEDAVISWLKLDPKPEVIILGNDEGTYDICKKNNLIHIPSTPTSSAGTPYIDSLIQIAEDNASNNIMLLVSGDIIIDQDTIEAAKSVKEKLKEFCVCARKKHVDITKNKIKTIRWATWGAGDYWLHTKGFYTGIPKFLIGRHMIEKWMYRWACNKNGLVDATEVITVMHQQHPHNFKPKNNELQYNKDLYWKNYMDVEKWKDAKWYSNPKHKHIGINHANFVMKEDYSLKDNVNPKRKGK